MTVAVLILFSMVIAFGVRNTKEKSTKKILAINSQLSATQVKAIPKVQKQTVQKNRKNSPSKKTSPTIEPKSETSSKIESAIEVFESIAALPGAYDLAYDIKDALLRDPKSIDMSQITYGPDHILRPDYLERMIPDEDLRTKWVELMEIIKNSANSEI